MRRMEGSCDTSLALASSGVGDHQGVPDWRAWSCSSLKAAEHASIPYAVSVSIIRLLPSGCLPRPRSSCVLHRWSVLSPLGLAGRPTIINNQAFHSLKLRMHFASPTALLSRQANSHVPVPFLTSSAFRGIPTLPAYILRRVHCSCKMLPTTHSSLVCISYAV